MKLIFAATGFFFFILLLMLFLLWTATADQCSVAILRNICGHKPEIFVTEILNRETALGVFISALGTVALVLTVYYSRQATLAAIEASHAARLAVEHARETSVRELRPYVTSNGHNNSRLLSSEDPAIVVCRRLEVVWKNVGKTPAINVRARTNHYLSNGPLPSDFSFPDREMNEVVGSLGPDGGFNSPTADISFDEVRAVMRGDRILHLWSWVEYEGFQAGTRYRSEYHSTISYWNSADPASPELNMTAHLKERFNGIDNTCFRSPVTTSAPRLMSDSLDIE